MKRVGVLSTHVVASAPMSGAHGGYYDNKYFHFIGEVSPVAEQMVTVPKSAGDPRGGSNTNSRMIETRRKGKYDAEKGLPPGMLDSDDHIQLLISDGTPRDLTGYHGANIGLAVRYSFPGDDELFPSEQARNAGTYVKIPNKRVEELVNMLETTPFKDITHKVSEGLRDGKFSHKEGLAAAMVAVCRNTEHVGDHHGGPIHPISGGWAVAYMSDIISKSGDRHGSAKQWADLPVVQSMSIACRHLENSRKLAGPAIMPELDLGDEIRAMTDPKEVCRKCGEAVLAQHPIRGEKLLVRALQLGAARGDLVTALMEEGVPRNCSDDHYQLYPNFAFLTLDAIGWEFAEPILRSALRYVSTVSPYGKDFWKTGTRFRDIQGIGGASDYNRVYSIGERLGLFQEGGVKEKPADPVAEREWAERLALKMSEEIPDTPPQKKEDDGGKSETDFIALMSGGPGDYARVAIAEEFGKAMAEGMSLEGALNALSLMAARLYIKQSVGNPMDTHFLNAIGARRNMWDSPGVPTRLKALSIMSWASGFEISGGVRACTPRTKGGLRNDLFGATRVPKHVEALLAGPNKPPEDPAELLDYISHAITVRNEEQTSVNGKNQTTHDTQMELLYTGKIGVQNCTTTNEVPTKVFPAIWLYFNKVGGDREAFWARMAEHTAMDDYSEMHAWKHNVACYNEYKTQPKEHAWIYACSCAKAICNHSGCGHLVFDLASDVLTDLKTPRVPGWHANGIPRGKKFDGTADHAEISKA